LCDPLSNASLLVDDARDVLFDARQFTLEAVAMTELRDFSRNDVRIAQDLDNFLPHRAIEQTRCDPRLRAVVDLHRARAAAVDRAPRRVVARGVLRRQLPSAMSAEHEAATQEGRFWALIVADALRLITLHLRGDLRVLVSTDNGRSDVGNGHDSLRC